MALLWRVLVRRAPVPRGPRQLPLLALLGLAPALTAGVALAGPDLATLKARQARTLEVLLERSPLPRAERSRRLFLLARLELELAILRGGGLDRPATTIRRVLVEDPGWAEADRGWFFLAELELRRGRHAAALEAVADLERGHPRSPLRCAGGLLATEAWSAQEKHDDAAARARRVLADDGCSAPHRQQARYRLAWAELARKRFAEAARELRALAADRAVEPALRARALKDLTTAWSLGEPDADAAGFLASRGGGSLVVELARGLFARRRLEPLLLLTASYLGQRASSPESAGLRRLRLRALAELGTPAALERELGAGRLPPGAAEAVLRATARLRRDEPEGARLARRLLARVAGAGGEDDATRAVRVELAELQLAAGELEAAVAALEAARRGATGAMRARASHALLRCLERRAASAPRADVAAALRRFEEEAWRFVREDPNGAKVPRVLLALASRLLEHGDAAGAARAAERLLGGRASSEERADGLRFALHAWDRAGRHERVYELAAAEARRAADGSAWRAAAARAALARARTDATAGRLADAAVWAERALAIDPGGALAGEARLQAGLLAARRGDLAGAERSLGQLGAAGGSNHAGQARAALAALHETRGAFAAAAPIRERLAREESGASRLDHQARAVQAWLAAAEPGRARTAARELGRLLEGERLAPGARLAWDLRVGELLAACGGEAQRYLRSRARALEAAEPRQAARLLGAAARLPGGTLALLERAVELAGPLRRRGAISEEAARLRLELLSRQRARLARARPAARLAALQAIIPALLPLLPAPKSGAAAASELEQSYALLEESLDRSTPEARIGELRALRRGLRERLAALARREEGLEPVTLEASRAASARWLPGLELVAPVSAPETATLSSLARSLLAAPAPRRVALARTLRLGASSALQVLGARADLHCALALAELSLGEPEAAWRHLEEALRLSPTDPCARHDLGVLALWRGDFVRARSLLAGTGLGEAAAAYGAGDREGAEQILRPLGSSDPEARYLLAVVLSETPGRRGEAIALLRSCIGGRVETAARARARLRELDAAARAPNS